MALEQLPVLSGQLELLDKIREGLLEGKIIVLGGASGSGRSVFCEKVLASMEEETTSEAYISSLDVDSGVQAQSLVLQQLFPEYLQTSQKSEEDSLKQLFTRYAESITAPCLVVLDDADCLSSAFLEIIADIIATLGKRLLLLVTCHTGSEKQLSALFLKKGCASLELRMPALSPDDCCIVEASASRCAGGDVSGRLHEREFFVGKEWTPGRIEQETQIVAAADRQQAVADKENKEVEKTGMSKEKNKLLLVLGTSVALIVICLVYCVLAYIRYVNEQSLTANMDASDNKSAEVTAATSEDSVVAALPDTLTEDNVVVRDGGKYAKNEIVLDDEALKSIADAEGKPQVDVLQVDTNVSSDSISQKEIVSDKAEKQEAPLKSASADKSIAVQGSANGANDAVLSKDLNKSSLTDKETQKNNNGTTQGNAKQAPNAPSVKELPSSTAITNHDSSLASNLGEASPAADKNAKSPSEKSVNQVNSANSDVSSQSPKVEEAASSDQASNNKKVTAQKFSELSGKSLVVQVIATPSRRNAEQTAAKLTGRVQTWVLNRPARGDFIAVAGPFASKSEADKAISTFPAEIRRAGPWTKSVAAVRRDLK